MNSPLRSSGWWVACALWTAIGGRAVENLPEIMEPSLANRTNGSYAIDLPATLRLAGAQNLDIQIARERLLEAEASRQSALEQFVPWLAPGVSYHRRDGVAQAIPAGTISDANFQSYSPGVSLSAQMALGDAIYNSLAARQLVRASDRALEAQRQQSILDAAQGYFDLAKAKAMVNVIGQALGVSQEYQRQLHAAVEAGIAFKGDELRVQVETQGYEISLRQAIEQQRLASALLAQALHLDARIELVPREEELVRLTLIETNASLDALVVRALAARPEIRQSQASIAAARAGKDGAVYGPLIPALGAQAFGGGLGGGADNGPSNLGPEGDFTLGVSWRLGPGGLFDAGRINSSKARLGSAKLNDLKLKDAITTQVVSALARVQSLDTQIELAEHSLATAAETLRLTRQRKQYGVGIVLEDIQAQSALAQARSVYVSALADYNKAQYSLERAVGGLGTGPGTP